MINVWRGGVCALVQSIGQSVFAQLFLLKMTKSQVLGINIILQSFSLQILLNSKPILIKTPITFYSNPNAQKFDISEVEPKVWQILLLKHCEMIPHKTLQYAFLSLTMIVMKRGQKSLPKALNPNLFLASLICFVIEFFSYAHLENIYHLKSPSCQIAPLNDAGNMW